MTFAFPVGSGEKNSPMVLAWNRFVNDTYSVSNYHLSLERMEKEFKGKLNGKAEIVFETEEDATYFILRWA